MPKRYVRPLPDLWHPFASKDWRTHHPPLWLNQHAKNVQCGIPCQPSREVSVQLKPWERRKSRLFRIGYLVSVSHWLQFFSLIPWRLSSFFLLLWSFVNGTLYFIRTSDFPTYNRRTHIRYPGVRGRELFLAESMGSAALSCLVGNLIRWTPPW